MTGAGAGGCVSVARGTGSAVPFVGGGGHRHGTAVAHVVAFQGSGCGALGSRGGASGSGSGASEREGRGGAAGSRRAVVGVSCGGGAGALPFAGLSPVMWPVWPLGRRRRGIRDPEWCCWVLCGGGKVPHHRVGVLRRVRRMRRRRRQVVRVRLLLGGLSWVGVGLGGPFGMDVVAGRIRFLVGGGQSVVVGGVVGLSAWYVVRPSHALVLFVHGGL